MVYIPLVYLISINASPFCYLKDHACTSVLSPQSLRPPSQYEGIESEMDVHLPSF